MASMDREEKYFTCEICDTGFWSKGRYAKYCPRCAKEQKKIKDKEAWERRKKKGQKEKESRIDAQRYTDKKRLAPVHAEELGIPLAYYGLWAETHPAEHEEWMTLHIGSSKSSKTQCCSRI